LRDYFLGDVGISALRADLKGAVTRTSHDVHRQTITDMEAAFSLSSTHLVSLCDAVLADQLPPSDLSVIAFCLVASEHFQWDADTPEGRLVEEMLYEWDSPEINYPLNLQTVAKFRRRLLTREDTFTRADIPKQQRKPRNA
jgi:hypothetical protein